MDVTSKQPHEPDEAPAEDELDLDEVGSHDLILDDGDPSLEDDSEEDIGTFDPDAADEDDDPSVFEDTEIDDLPDVGEQDPDEEPELDELEALALEQEEPRG